MQSAPLPTVGDTIWMLRVLRVPAGAQVRAPDWQPEGPVERLGEARITRRGDLVEVAWPLVGWTAGTHQLDVPGPLLIYGNGREDTLAAQAASITVASVLPASDAAKLQPQPAAGYVLRGTTSVVPVLVALLAAGAIVALLALWRRRTRPAIALPSVPAAAAVPLERWHAAGERDLLLERLVGRLTPRAEEPEVAAWLHEADVVRFASSGAEVRDALLARGNALAGSQRG